MIQIYILNSIKIACFDGHFEIVQLLVDNNADINARDNDGHNAIYWGNQFKLLNLINFNLYISQLPWIPILLNI
jgi:ankyrin repeat protein